MTKQTGGEFWASVGSDKTAPESAASPALKPDLSERIDRQTRVFDAILSSIGDFAYSFDDQGRFLFINRALLDLWGMKLEDAVGKTFFELPYPKELAEVLHKQIQHDFATGKELKDETLYVNSVRFTYS